LPKDVVGSSPDAIVAAFTELFKDIMADARIRLVPLANGGSVHRGFNALDAIYDKLKHRLRELQQEKPSRPSFFTGHSLGAAPATLAAERFGFVQGLYTFGSPRVGDAAFKDGFRVKSAFRTVHNNDIVTRVPLAISRHHWQLGSTPTSTWASSSTSTTTAESTMIPRFWTASATACGAGPPSARPPG
jgi:triacylglycerol lipase